MELWRLRPQDRRPPCHLAAVTNSSSRWAQGPHWAKLGEAIPSIAHAAVVGKLTDAVTDAECL